MTQQDKDDLDDKSGDEREGGQDGKSGGILFRYKDPSSVGQRDDTLPAAEIKRLLAVHDELHKARVDQQKIVRKARQAAKEGKMTAAAEPKQAGLGRRGGRGERSPYKKHPISELAQFSGDRQIDIPAENREQTNLEEREALENQHQLRHQHVPKFNPKPRPY